MPAPATAPFRKDNAKMSNTSSASIRVDRDIRYGEAEVGFGTDRRTVRPLLLDAFMPSGDVPPGGRPALLLAHGGAFHRGAKDQDEFEQGADRNTPVHEYCERFAARGFACFSIGYRLTQERCGPLPQPIKRTRDRIQRDRIDYVRQLLGLPVATNEELVFGAEGAFTDVAQAFRFVQQNAPRWGIDTRRMALGGFSAGGYAAAYGVFALGLPASAIICLSSGMAPEDAEHYVRAENADRYPPVLFFFGEADLPGVAESEDAVIAHAARARLRVRQYLVPGKPHFYDREAKIVLKHATMPGGEGCDTVETAMVKFLDEALR